ncbi:MAG: amino acid adenylation domain-containing protein [Alphaproteobacteria bacterium]|nr:amino acid adenylation domain-containing protein [Alphaproteobacteria bacterium]MBU2092522.1 amino acid adenylation domain-containing protein [Alphaproteobacteria bacterium]MBU2151366.1 amino acid adenylation domain-containing protein [Alphaproteobacteria bacterium]
MSLKWLTPLRRAPRITDNAPLSQNEERYVLAEAVTHPVYAIPWWHTITGPLDLARLSDAIQAVCTRHEALRTGFRARRDGTFVKYVEPTASPRVEVVDAPGADDAEVRRILRERFFRKPDLSPDSLKVFVLVRLSPTRHVFGFSLHHSISDGQSSRLFADQVFKSYAGDDMPAARAFSAVIDPDWLHSEAYAEAREGWRVQLAQIPAAAGWPADLADPARMADDDRVRMPIPAEVLAASEAAAARIGVSLFFYVYAVALLTLSRLTGSSHVQTAFQSHGRRAFADAGEVIGSFSNALVLPMDVDETESIAALARRVRAASRSAVDREAFPYHHLIREFGVHPNFGVNWFPNLGAPVAPGLEISAADVSDSQSDYDLNFRFVRTPGGLELVIFYKPGSFSEDRVLAAGRLFAGLAGALSAAPDAPMSSARSVDMAPAGVLPDALAPLPASPQPTVFARFLGHAAATPDATAITHRGKTYTYAQVEQSSRRVARSLRRQGVQAGETVAIVAERHPSLIWLMLGVSRAGGVFVVLDSNYPEQRLQTLADIVSPRTLLTTEGAQARTAATHLAASSGATLLAVKDGEAAADEAAWLDRADPDQPAYQLFTSGSTGRPKCVVCAHGPLSHFVGWQESTFDLGPTDRFTLLSGLSHDPLLRDVFTPLSIGASVHVPDQAVLLEPGGLRQWFDEVRPTVAHTTPPLGRLLITTPHEHPPLNELRHIFWGGDLLAPDLLDEVAKHAPNVESVNVYGSTETPQAAGFHRAKPGTPWRHVPVGLGIDGFQLIVVDDERQPRGIGEVGEIAVRSSYLSLGYLGGEGPQKRDRGGGPAGGAETYYTGDRGVHLPDGEVLALGRQDDQIKIRGYRVDLSEVAAALATHPDVDAAHAVVINRQTNPQIIAFIAGQALAEDSEGAVLAHAAQRLPDYMMPHGLQRLAAIPLLPNGKIDREAMRILAEQRPAPAAPSGRPETPTEAELVDKWADLLPWAQVSADSSFFTLGGDSLTYVEVYLATEAIIGAAPDGWQFMSIRELAAGRRETNRWLATIDTPMLIRAISIFLVVGGHFSLIHYAGGATAALFAVSGFLFGGLQLPEAIENRTARPVWRVFASLLLPTFLYTTALFTAKLATGQDPDLSSPLLYGNFRDYSLLGPPDWGGNEFYLWFVDCILQIFLILGVAIMALARWRFLGLDRFGVAMLLFFAGCLGRFVLPGFVFPGFFEHGAQPLTMVLYLPTTHLPTFMLGALAASAAAGRRRWIVLALTAAYASASFHFYGPNSGIFIGTAVTLMLFVRRIVTLRPLSRFVYILSGASLFIYLTHFQWGVVLRWLHIPDEPVIQVAVAGVGGILVWMLWNRVVHLFAPARRRLEEAPSAM